MALNANRRGIACAGNWIVDHVKIVDVWPKPGNLANILAEEKGTGGCAFNVFVDLSRLEPSLPLEAIGLVGDDDDGRWIIEHVRPFAGPDHGLLVQPGAPTSYTDVMTVESTGARTFFHMRGANAFFDIEHVRIESLRSKIFILGYLLLLDRFDSSDPEYGTRAARLLAECQRAGLLTAIDLVSAEAGRFAEVATPAMRYTDFCILNEVESGGVTGEQIRAASGDVDWNAAKSAAKKLAELGVRRNVTIHLPEGAISLDVASGEIVQVPSLKLPEGFIKGAAGAGDAFCAGMLLGLHEDWPLEKSLRVAHASAAASMRHPTCTQAMATLKEVLKLEESLQFAAK